MEKKIKAYMMRLGKDEIPCQGYIGEIDNTLEAKQKYVGGLMQVISLNGQVDIICNDEGKLQGLLPNRAFVKDGKVLDIFVGDILACRHDNEGNFTSIEETDIPLIEQTLEPIAFMLGNKVITCKADELPVFEQ